MQYVSTESEMVDVMTLAKAFSRATKSYSLKDINFKTTLFWLIHGIIHVEFW